MGAEDKAIGSVQRSLKLKGGLGFWVAATLVMFLGLVLYFGVKPLAERWGSKMSARLDQAGQKLKGAVGAEDGGVVNVG